MARPLRYIPPGELVEVTNRTFQGRFLLLPTPKLRSLVLGALGRSQRRFAMPIHAFTFASNHFHLLLTPNDAKHLAEFMGYFQAKLAREVQRLHGWSGAVWSGRYHAIPVASDERTQLDRLAYVLSHGVKEDLVARAQDWPGANCVDALTKGAPLVGVWYDRTALYRATRWGRTADAGAFAEEEKVCLSPLPCWSQLAWGEIHQRTRSIIDMVEAEARIGHKSQGTRPLGARAILAHSPIERPQRLKHSFRPWCHARDRERRQEMRGAYRLFVLAFRQAAANLARGHARPSFPPGSFPPGLPFVPHPALE